jgi:hypothetical protein
MEKRINRPRKADARGVILGRLLSSAEVLTIEVWKAHQAVFLVVP